MVKRGELYCVFKPSPRDPRRSRVLVVVSRQVLIDSRFSTVICAPIYSIHHGLPTQVSVGIDEGFKHDSSIHCGELISILKSDMTNFIGTLSPEKILELDSALAVALDLPQGF